MVLTRVAFVGLDVAEASDPGGIARSGALALAREVKLDSRSRKHGTRFIKQEKPD